ncbi:hypothetical protein D3C79_578220 [compost metagenome]
MQLFEPGFEPSQGLVVIAREEPDDAPFALGNQFLGVGDLLLDRLIATNVEHGIPGLLGRPGDGLPRGLQRAQVALNLPCPAVDGLGIQAGRHGSSVHRPALILQGLDVGVLRRGEDVQLAVELFDGLDRVLADLVEGLDDLCDVPSGLLRPGQRGLGDFHVHGAQRVAGGSQLRENPCGRTNGPARCRHLVGHISQLVGGQPSGVAVLYQRIGESLGLFRALVVGNSQNASSCCSCCERVDQAGDVAAHGSCSRADAAKHVLQLAALLKQNSERGLAGLEADRDVGELSWKAAHCCAVGLSRHASPVHAVGCPADLCTRLADACCIFFECVRIHQTGTPEPRKALLLRIQAIQSGYRRVYLPKQLRKLAALLIQASGYLIGRLACGFASALHALERTGQIIRIAPGAPGVNRYGKAGFLRHCALRRQRLLGLDVDSAAAWAFSFCSSQCLRNWSSRAKTAASNSSRHIADG